LNLTAIRSAFGKTASWKAILGQWIGVLQGTNLSKSFLAGQPEDWAFKLITDMATCLSQKTIPDDWEPRFDFGLLEVVNPPVNWPNQ